MALYGSPEVCVQKLWDAHAVWDGSGDLLVYPGRSGAAPAGPGQYATFRRDGDARVAWALARSLHPDPLPRGAEGVNEARACRSIRPPQAFELLQAEAALIAGTEMRVEISHAKRRALNNASSEDSHAHRATGDPSHGPVAEPRGYGGRDCGPDHSRRCIQCAQKLP